MSENPSSLIAMRDSITAGRINMIMRQRGWRSKAIGGNDSLIESYLEIRPRVTFLGLDTGSISGELAALRIREIDDQARIVFVCSRSKMEAARQASHSAGAVGVISTPILATDIEEAWPKIMGVVPYAPGLATLEPVTPPPPITLPPPPPPVTPQIPNPSNTSQTTPQVDGQFKQGSRGRIWMIISLVGLAISGSIAYYLTI